MGASSGGSCDEGEGETLGTVEKDNAERGKKKKLSGLPFSFFLFFVVKYTNSDGTTPSSR